MDNILRGGGARPTFESNSIMCKVHFSLQQDIHGKELMLSSQHHSAVLTALKKIMFSHFSFFCTYGLATFTQWKSLVQETTTFIL